MTVAFECITRANIPKAQLFDLARSIDAHTESMAASREQAISGVTSGLISLGEDVTWRAWHFGLPLRMTSRITRMEAPDVFIDEQISGPFQSFRHVHEFIEFAGVTTMIDRIEFQAPFGLLGRLAEKLVLARYLQKLIETRNRHLVGDSSRG
ncbi:cyclase [Arthrobacter alpinus]|uniref:SRPBCC family protein n=1 Tax=Arthrobacter alpinus TaxID=656366 RepID=UPI0005CB2C01|nr:SRPBCC family protein [Arthrobacter alpinus]ALV47184.1 cyclase [Arthrobacter alpinus]